MLTGYKIPQCKGNNVTGVLKSSKPYFAWYIKQPAAAKTTFSITRSLYCMCQVSHCLSNLTTIPSSCILLTLQSVLKQNLTCRSLSSFCRIPFILGKLKIELTKNPLHHAGKNGSIPVDRTCNGGENGGHSCEENFH